MSQRPASDGRKWLKEGFAVFRKQPGGLGMLLLAIFIVLSLCSRILGPVLGMAVVLLMPAVSVTFMRASAQVELGRQVTPALLLSGLQKPVRLPLLMLGAVQLAGVVVMQLIILGLDNGIAAKVQRGELPQEAIVDTNLHFVYLGAMLCYLPFVMALCYSPALAYWQDMKPAKALFYSFFAVLRSLKAFIVLFACLFGMLIPPVIVILLLFRGSSVGAVLIAPLTLVFGIVLQCALYASYRDIFGVPAAEAEGGKPAA